MAFSNYLHFKKNNLYQRQGFKEPMSQATSFSFTFYDLCNTGLLAVPQACQACTHLSDWHWWSFLLECPKNPVSNYFTVTSLFKNPLFHEEFLGNPSTIFLSTNSEAFTYSPACLFIFFCSKELLFNLDINYLQFLLLFFSPH